MACSGNVAAAAGAVVSGAGALAATGAVASGAGALAAALGLLTSTGGRIIIRTSTATEASV
jgi:hypothetical protein